MERLTELHGIVKEHPFRLNFDDRYKDSYRKSLVSLQKEFYEEAKKIPCLMKDGKHFKAINFYHDFSSAIGQLFYGDVQKYGQNAIIHIERCIGAIHKFIDTGRFDEYYAYGRPEESGERKCLKYTYRKSTGEFAPIYSKEEIDLILLSLEERILHSKEGKREALELTRNYFEEYKNKYL